MEKGYQVIQCLIYIDTICNNLLVLDAPVFCILVCLTKELNISIKITTNAFMHNRLNVSNHGARDDLNMYKNESNLSC